MSADPVVGVLALQGDVREHLHALAEADVIARRVRRVEDLDGVDALVIPGGESTTISKLAIEFGLFEPVAERIAAGMPAYGSCAGMIMLAAEVLDGRPDQRSFGGIDMVVRRNAFGRQVDSFEGSVELDGIPGGAFHAVFIRAPWVERVGDGVEVIGRLGEPGAGETAAGQTAVGQTAVGQTAVGQTAVGQTAVGQTAVGQTAGGQTAGRIVAVRQRNVLATAFHPELTGDLRVHRYFVGMVRGAQSGVSHR